MLSHTGTLAYAGDGRFDVASRSEGDESSMEKYHSYTVDMVSYSAQSLQNVTNRLCNVSRDGHVPPSTGRIGKSNANK
ncbi:hypothetical protein KIN20_023583 [Parelaphostrongylus tenuis]|uniref:Uncharacterized protein n=1 Tax=Parelaphostrongylus tenuis TaxID=148309 RepID=A0AAD5QVX7_PARTN|nr:hypothetical protein KIN20_023583 [Parelaphostrongylus tenuis]